MNYEFKFGLFNQRGFQGLQPLCQMCHQCLSMLYHWKVESFLKPTFLKLLEVYLHGSLGGFPKLGDFW